MSRLPAPPARFIVPGLCLLICGCVVAPTGTGPTSAVALPDAGVASVRLLHHQAVLVRGWIGATGAELEPVLASDARPSTFESSAERYRLRSYDAAGLVLFDVSFGEAALSSIPGREGHHFMLVIPVGEGGSLALARIELEIDGQLALVREARLASAAMFDALRGDAGLALEQIAPGELRVRWDAARFSLLQLRDPDSGAILALARHGDITLSTERTAFDVTLSDGVRSATGRVQLR